MKTVLVTSIGSMSSRIIIETLKKNGFRVIGSNIYPEELIVERSLVDVFYNVPRTTHKEEYIDTLQDIIKRESIDYVFPLTDPEIDVINDNREKINVFPCKICISNEKTISLCRNKRRLNEFISSNLKNVKCVPDLKPEEINENRSFPIVLKPCNGRSSEGVHLIMDYDEWCYYRDHVNLDSSILQPFIEGDVVCADVLRHASGGQIEVLPRREMLRTKNGAGLSVHVFNDPKLIDQCRRLAEQLDINGCVNFEFIMKDDKPDYYFLECNPRFSGGIAFSCLSGYDFIMNHLRCFDGSESIDKMDRFDNYFAVKMYTETVTKTERSEL